MLKNKKLVALVIVAIVACIVVRCSIKAGTTPSKTIEKAFKAADAGKYTEFEGYLSKSTINSLNSSIGQIGGGAAGLANCVSKDSTVNKIEIEKEDIKGNTSSVSYKIIYDNGTVTKEEQKLIKEDGKWKIHVPFM